MQGKLNLMLSSLESIQRQMGVQPEPRINANTEFDTTKHSPSWNFPLLLSTIPSSITAVNGTHRAPSYVPFKGFTSSDSNLQMVQHYPGALQHAEREVHTPPWSAVPPLISAGRESSRTQIQEDPYLVSSPHKLLWLIDRAEAVRLCDLYEREIGIIYPVVDMSEVKQNLGSLYNAYEAANYTPGSPIPPLKALQNVADGDVKTLKLVLAITLLAEGGGRHTMAEAMCEEIQQQLVFPKGQLSELKDIENTALLVRTFPFPLLNVVSVYQLHDAFTF